MKVFDNPGNQPQLCKYLQTAVDAGRTTHAYLLVGGQDAEMRQIATRFASALIAGEDASAFDACLRGAHPDLHAVAPSGAAGYLIDQVRELVHDAELAPIRAQRKVYIVSGADRLSGPPANALLKTLEEPPADVVCILLAQHEHAVLETVRSRCEILRAREALSEQPHDEEAFNLLYNVVSGATNAQVLAAAKRIVELSGAGTDELEEQYAEKVEASEEFMTQGARKELEAQHKREVTAHTRKALLGEVAAIRSWLRDALLTASGAPDMIAHERWRAQTMQVATDAGVAGVLAALDAVKACEERISYNVTPQLAVEALLFEIKEAVCR